ncbi:arginyltransferase [Pelagibius sp. Alg239-R121]|uniref:arginyltransferase n=1 Tax=Pelagibius sp. Alg239-R121 TaxID=2993448 RepID=UPI0024A659A6|nr:arginyltransferase [Pelagibius sp. Alg239-R121]
MKLDNSSAQPGTAASHWHAPPQVYCALPETPCPYLEGKWERKVMTDIAGANAVEQYDLLSRAGFRRSHFFAYRPACSGCQACVPVRVVAGEFQPGKSLKRVQKRNEGLRIIEQAAVATREQYALFDLYLTSRHADGEMIGMRFDDYSGMIEHSRLNTSVVEFREADGRLIAACLVDWLVDGPSAVYSFFDPDLETDSLGSYMVLWLIQAAVEKGLPYVYLGYWIKDSPKMSYKTRFRPIQRFSRDGWEVFTA